MYRRLFHERVGVDVEEWIGAARRHLPAILANGDRHDRGIRTNSGKCSPRHGIGQRTSRSRDFREELTLDNVDDRYRLCGSEIVNHRYFFVVDQLHVVCRRYVARSLWRYDHLAYGRKAALADNRQHVGSLAALTARTKRLCNIDLRPRARLNHVGDGSPIEETLEARVLIIRIGVEDDELAVAHVKERGVGRDDPVRGPGFG